MNPSPYRQKKCILKKEHIAAHYFLWHFTNLGIENLIWDMLHVGETIFKLSSLIRKVEVIVRNTW